ncbi:50S ribosomal protein L6, partial [Lactobacillus delbrueckii subsp. bulgaricus]|nr:50S ribosomal protein L6 [Lactobacillus delbrueckii subsp. bulgaricus]
MSRIGLKVINVPESVTVTKNGNEITVKGPKGELTREFDPRIKFEQEDGVIRFSRSNENDKAIHGTMRANLANMIEGVVNGYKKELKLIG